MNDIRWKAFCMDMFVKILFLIVLLTITACSGQNKTYCTPENYARAQTLCYRAYEGPAGSNMSPICGSLDCFLQCLKDAISDCWKTDQLFQYEVKTTVVQFRAQCQDLEKTKRANKVCNLKCKMQHLTPNYTQIRSELFNTGDFAGYKQVECRNAREVLKCIPTDPVGPECTAELEELSKGIETVRYSWSECGIAQDHQFFKTYADKGTPCPNPAINSNCLLPAISERTSKCLKIPGLTSGSSDLTTNVCSDIECNLKCYLDAIGDCYKEDKLLNMDPLVIKVVGRAICDNRQGSISTLTLCPVNNQTCEDELNSTWTEARKHLMSGDYTGYKRSLCQASYDFKACVDVTVTRYCTSSMAEQARKIYQTGYSFDACGSQYHAYFTKYGGDVNCVTTSTSSRLMTYFSDIMLLTVILMLRL